MKALFCVWSEVRLSDLNRILKPHSVKLVAKGSKAWGKQVNVTAHAVVPTKRVRAVGIAPKHGIVNPQRINDDVTDAAQMARAHGLTVTGD